MKIDDIIIKLEEMANPAYLEGMARYGIKHSSALGVRIPDLRRLARKVGQNHNLALALWKTRIHEA